MERTETARATLRPARGAEPDDVAVTTSVSAGVSPSRARLDFERRPRVVVSDFEFPTIGQIWHAQELRGAEVVHVPAGRRRDPARALRRGDRRANGARGSSPRSAIRNGSRLPIEEIAELAHERGALVLLDAYQAIGTYPLDVESLGVDFLAAGVLKYLLASAGLAFLWCRSDLVEQLTPTQTGWFADRDIFEMDIDDYSPSPTATRFQSGTPPVPAIYAGIAGMELMEEIGIAETREHVNGLNERLIAGVDELGGSRRDAARARAARRARLHPLDRCARARRRARWRTASSSRSATATSASRRTPTTPTTTSTSLLAALRRHRGAARPRLTGR